MKSFLIKYMRRRMWWGMMPHQNQNKEEQVTDSDISTISES
jgi:hypothetical protein